MVIARYLYPAPSLPLDSLIPRYRLSSVGLILDLLIFAFCFARRTVILPRFRIQANMDQIADRSSTLAASLPMNAYSREVSSAYSSPISATASHPGFSPPIGLGIMNCGLDPTFDHTAGYQRPMLYPMSPVNQSPNSLLHTTAFHGSPLQPRDTPNRICFPAHSGFQDWNGSQEMSASPNYISNLKIQRGEGVFHQMPEYWAPTPTSGPTSPVEALFVNPAGAAGLQVPGRNQYCTPLKSPTSLVNFDASYPMNSTGDSSKYSFELQNSSAHVEPFVFVNNSSESGDMALTGCSVTKAASSNRFSCPKCGNTFTRRSNCKQHEKQHDPESRKISRVSCPECSKTFGRKGDLRRHFNNVRRVKPSYLTNAYPRLETSSYSRTSL